MKIESAQVRVASWCMDVLGWEATYDKKERSARVLEEAVELTQSAGLSREASLLYLETALRETADAIAAAIREQNEPEEG